MIKVNESLLEHVNQQPPPTFSSSPHKQQNEIFFDSDHDNRQIVDDSLTKKLSKIHFKCALIKKNAVNLTLNKLKTLNGEQIELTKRL